MFEERTLRAQGEWWRVERTAKTHAMRGKDVCQNAYSHSSSCRSVVEAVLMQKDLGTVSGQDGVEVLQARRLPPDHVAAPQFKTWHSSRMKTGLRNRIILFRTSLVGLRV